jgi:hypothetical protein
MMKVPILEDLTLMKKFRDILLVALLLFVVFLLYTPGLTGGYIFDDAHNITNNQKIAIETLDIKTLTAAFWSGNTGPLGRPISMLSFALNHYFTGLDPYFFKLTNLFIHLVNITLVFWLVHSMLRAFVANRFNASNPNAPRFPFYGAVLAAAIWGLHPLNLTSVLYIVQRMTSLSTLFGLLALALYAAWRTSPWNFSRLRNGLTGLAIFLCLLASIFSKESGLLFIPLLIWIELLIFKGMHNEHPIRFGSVTLKQLIWGICGLGFLATLFLLPGHFAPENFYNRNFTLTERALTESRVIFYYLRLFFLPSLSELGLYHDDFLISQSLFQPYYTLISVLGLIAITAGTFLFRKKYSLWLFAWGWFLISHALESTVFSLELVHEHRNYFATLGFLVLLPWLLAHISLKIRPSVFLVVGVFIVLCGFITWQRALIWSTPLTHATFEAETHPQSYRANSQLAHIYLQLLDRTQDERYIDLTKQSLQKAITSYKPDNGSQFSLMFLAYGVGKTPDPTLVRQLKQNLREKPFTNVSITFLQTFSECQTKKMCHMPHREAINLLAAALDNPRIGTEKRAMINQILGLYFVDNLEDFEKGEAFLNEAVRLHPDITAHLHLALILRLRGKWNSAREQIEIARQLDNKNAWFREIEQELARLARAEQAEREKVYAPNAPSGSTLQP